MIYGQIEPGYWTLNCAKISWDMIRKDQKVKKKQSKKSLSKIGGIPLITEAEIEKYKLERRKIIMFPKGRIVRLDNNRHFLLLDKEAST